MSYTALPFYRRTFIVDANLQLKIIVFTIYVISLTLATAFCIFQIRTQSDLSSSMINWLTALGIVLLAFFVILPALLLSFSIAGPVYRLKSNMIQIISGNDFKTLHFRKSDCFHEVAGIYNQLNDYYMSNGAAKSESKKISP